MDVWGVSGPEAEVELIAATVECFKSLGLSGTEVGIKVGPSCVLTTFTILCRTIKWFLFYFVLNWSINLYLFLTFGRSNILRCFLDIADQ